MAVAQQYAARQSGGRGGPSGLADVLDVLLDKGLVIDAFVRVSLVGIELLTIDARVVIAGVDTYLHFAEAVNRLDLLQATSGQTMSEMVSGGGGKSSGQRGSSQQRQLEKPQRHDEDDHPSGPSDDNADRQHSDRGNGHDDSSTGKGLLSRLVDRGQAF